MSTAPAPPSWREGPPPLDKPGYYVCATHMGIPSWVRKAMWIAVTDRGNFAFWESSPAPESLSQAEARRRAVLMHYGPIPDPPSP